MELYITLYAYAQLFLLFFDVVIKYSLFIKINS